jgi:hypothetical protein
MCLPEAKMCDALSAVLVMQRNDEQQLAGWTHAYQMQMEQIDSFS